MWTVSASSPFLLVQLISRTKSCGTTPKTGNSLSNLLTSWRWRDNLITGLLRVANNALNGRKSGSSIFLRESICSFGELANMFSQSRWNSSDATSPPRPTALTVVWYWSPACIFLWSVAGSAISGVVLHFTFPNLYAHSSVWTMYSTLKRLLCQDLLLLALVSWWKIWEVRNKELHGSTEGIPSDIVAWSHEYLTLYHEAQVKPIPPSSTPLLTSWIPPDLGYIKVNADAAFPENSNFFRVGMIARDDRGVTKWWTRKEIQGRPQPTDGEAMAILFGIQTAIHHKCRKVIVETDCLPVHGYLVEKQRGLVS